MKRILLALLIMFSFACEQNGPSVPPTVPVTGISFTGPPHSSFYVGLSYQYSAEVVPSDATNQNITWSTTNTAVATIDLTGLVTIKEEGTFRFQAVTEDGDFTYLSPVKTAEYATYMTAGQRGVIYKETVGTDEIRFILIHNYETNLVPHGKQHVIEGTASVSGEIYMADTGVTTTLAIKILQWAFDNGRLSPTLGVHNEVSSTVLKYGGQTLLDYTDTYNKVSYADSTFSVETGYETVPVSLTWYGAIMLCNWLTEMRDGNTDEVVYTNIGTSWTASATVGDYTKEGYRLPTHGEFLFAGLFMGETVPTEGSLAEEYIALGHNDDAIPSLLRDGYIYAHPMYYVSGASDRDDFYLYAWFRDHEDHPIEPVKTALPNYLGIYDLSGNRGEWITTQNVDGSLTPYLLDDGMRLGVGNISTTSVLSISRLNFHITRTR